MPESFYYILFSVIFISIVLAWIKSETLANPTTIYVLWWGGFIFLSTFNLIGMRIPSMHAYQLIVLSLVMFSVGSITFLSNKKFSATKYKNIDFLKNNSIKIKIFFYFQIIFTFILILLVKNTIGMLKNFDPATFRMLVYTSEGTLGKYLMVFAYFVKPSLYASAFISIAGTLLGKLPKIFFIISFINLLLYSIATVGRFPIFLVVIVFFLSIIFINELQKVKLRYILSIIVLVSFIISVSVFRKTGQSFDIYSIIKNYFVWYFTGPFTAFDYFLNNYKPGIDYDFSYFRGFIAGIEWLIEPFAKKASFPFENINHSIHEITATFRSLGGEATSHNSHYTMLFTFYRDAGIFGIIIYSFILGMINSSIFNLFRKKYSIVSFSMLLIVLYLSIMGILKWEIRYIWSVSSILIILFISQKIVIKRKAF